MSFLGDAFSIPAPKTKDQPSDGTKTKQADGLASSAATQEAPPPAADAPEVTAEDSAPRTTDPAVAAASSRVMTLTPPVPGTPAQPKEAKAAPVSTGGEAPAVEEEEARVVSITDRAVQEVRRIIEEQKLPAETGIRLGVQGGGCSGFSYKLAFETVKAPLDWEGSFSGVRTFIDPKSFLYLSGIELDFQDSLMGRGFVFNNPNAKKTCGCGESFQV